MQYPKNMRVSRRAFLSPCLTPPNKGLHSLHNFAWMVLDTLLCLQKLKKIEDVRLLKTGCFKSLEWWKMLINVCFHYLHNQADIPLPKYNIFRITLPEWFLIWPTVVATSNYCFIKIDRITNHYVFANFIILLWFVTM